MERHIEVAIGLINNMAYCRGDRLSDFPRYGMLDDADNSAWRAWLSTQEVNDFLDRMIIRCQTQAVINQESVGYVVMVDIRENEKENKLLTNR